MLEISRLSLSLGQQALLRDLSLTLHPGQVHVIIGPNGTGKTSLMRALFGELTPAAGEIRLAGQSSRQMPQAKWRQQFGYMPQNIQLELDLSVIEVVVLGRLDSLSMRLADEDILAAGRALQALGIAHLADRPLYSLSGGQRQMVLFAQVLLRDPRIMMLDEPVSGRWCCLPRYCCGIPAS
ncbi:ABC transporter ATP-binding protein [Aeromonas salmonicida]|uniref:ABC transporter ATP-binding protein n=1 Tax=Aeromonas salmonicida TaxID=645 RepID=UPI0004453314|nr:ABC transporter ATP-binding protein [Aeromonas salmonicida]ELI6406803.1 ABC transporter ATP-binding protein [Aeromonas salmonicida subsp. salmonicida]ELI6437443.1 ABC transporter ATP-binding protein [Aeromonas salmonicida subsp. salmonicida]ELM3603369.1 ABC transporter ATP-binding protein [Aeromonas salmonicida subsp. salmonicida]ELM3641823.1 ABC transporter ATP-binding protein [Aeromonas salmonicida subsp. salmonicida]ELM3733613.1 ABC transporter ATP-binding protein [Aeromonas salmonicida 